MRNYDIKKTDSVEMENASEKSPVKIKMENVANLGLGSALF